MDTRSLGRLPSLRGVEVCGSCIAGDMLLVAEWGNHRVSVFDKTSLVFLRHVGENENDGSGWVDGGSGRVCTAGGKAGSSLSAAGAVSAASEGVVVARGVSAAGGVLAICCGDLTVFHDITL